MEEKKEVPPLIEVYTEYVTNMIVAKEDLHPYPGMAVSHKTKEFSVFAYATDPKETIISAVTFFLSHPETDEMFVGIDRFSKPGQGIDAKYDFVFTIIKMDKKNVTFGILPYNKEGEFGPIDWTKNEFWGPIMESEMIKATAAAVKKLGINLADLISQN